MDLTNSIKKAAQQQPARNTKNTECVKKGVNLGAGRMSRYGYSGSGRPTMEGWEVTESDGQIFNG